MTKFHRILFGSLAVLLALAMVSPAQATNGYFTHGYGTIAKALAGAGVAMPQDTMAAATNPAGMVVVGKRYDAGIGVFSPDRSYTVTGNPSGFPGTFGLTPGKVESDSNYFYIPYFGGNWRIGDNMTLGVNLYGHGGMNTDYPAATFYAGQPTGVNLEQLFVGIPWAVEFADKHSIGIMPIFVYQTFEAQGVGSFAPFSSDPTKLSDNGKSTSTGYGAKVGYLGRFTDMFSFGISYQTEMSMDEFADYAGLFAERGGFNIPASLTAGIAIHATPSHEPAGRLSGHLLQRHQVDQQPLAAQPAAGTAGRRRRRRLRLAGYVRLEVRSAIRPRERLGVALRLFVHRPTDPGERGAVQHPRPRRHGRPLHLRLHQRLSATAAV